MNASSSTLDGKVARDAPLDPPPLGSRAMSAPAVLPSATEMPPRGSRTKTLILVFLALVALGAGARFGWHWWMVGRFEEVTDDAFLQADKVVVAPKVGGFVTDVRVTDNQPVEAGDVIAQIDDRDYQVLLLQDQADLDKAKASLAGVAAALIQQQARIVQAKADVENTTAALAFSRQEERRYGDLVARGAGTTQRSQQASSDLLMKQAALDRANAGYDAAQKQIDGLSSLEAAARASLRRAEINLQQAQLNIGYTTVKAPISGVVGDRALRKGQFVQPGTSLLTLVPMGEAIYVVANFKETQIGLMERGQGARFTVDAFGDHVFRGHIDSFAPGTGSQFALLPPENATGNFTKIVQRVPVKITIDPGDPLLGRLRPGLSAEAVIDTRDEPLREPLPPKNAVGLLAP
jgi:membrane fusion protein (multidrug efflux system)